MKLILTNLILAFVTALFRIGDRLVLGVTGALGVNGGMAPRDLSNLEEGDLKKLLNRKT